MTMTPEAADRQRAAAMAARIEVLEAEVRQYRNAVVDLEAAVMTRTMERDAAYTLLENGLQAIDTSHEPAMEWWAEVNKLLEVDDA